MESSKPEIFTIGLFSERKYVDPSEVHRNSPLLSRGNTTTTQFLMATCACLMSP